MEEIYMLGPFLIRISWLIMLVGMIIGFIILRLYPVHHSIKVVQDILLNAVIYSLLIWRFSPLMFRFDLVIRDPLAALYYPSGRKELFLALIFLFGYLWWQRRRQGIAYSVLLTGLISVGAPALFIYFFFQVSYGKEIESAWLNWIPIDHHPLHLYQLFIYGVMILAIISQYHRDDPSAFVRRILIGWGGAQWFITLVDPNPTWFGIPISSSLYVVLFLLGLLWEFYNLIKLRKSSKIK